MTFKIVKARPEEYPVFAQLIRETFAGMEKKEWYVPDDEEYLKRVMEKPNGLPYKAIEPESGALAGILVVVIPGMSEENMGLDIGLSREEMERAAHIDTIVVRPEYRGYCLQRKLMKAAEEDLAEMGYCNLMCTVHPDNVFSKNNMIKLGYNRMATKEKYGGLLRDIMLKHLG